MNSGNPSISQALLSTRAERLILILKSFGFEVRTGHECGERCEDYKFVIVGKRMMRIYRVTRGNDPVTKEPYNGNPYLDHTCSSWNWVGCSIATERYGFIGHGRTAEEAILSVDFKSNLFHPEKSQQT